MSDAERLAQYMRNARTLTQEQVDERESRKSDHPASERKAYV